MKKETQPLPGKRNKRRSTSYDPSRREFLKYAAAAGVLSTIGIGYLFKDNLFPSNDETVILGEANRLGIRKSRKEIDLWSHASLDLPRNLPVQGNEKLVDSIFLDTLNRMYRSENEEYSDASKRLLNLFESKKLRFVKLSKREDPKASLGVAFGLDSQGQLEFEFNVNLDFILNKSTPPILAGIITHEDLHLQRFMNYLNSLSPASGAVQKAKMESYFYAEEQMLIEEAVAYAKEAEAYTRQAGLFGKIYAEKISGQEDRAAKFILSGKDPNGREWRSYIKKILK